VLENKVLILFPLKLHDAELTRNRLPEALLIQELIPQVSQGLDALIQLLLVFYVLLPVEDHVMLCLFVLLYGLDAFGQIRRQGFYFLCELSCEVDRVDYLDALHLEIVAALATLLQAKLINCLVLLRRLLSL